MLYGALTIYIMDQRKLKAIQCRVTKLIPSLCESDYSTRLTELQLPSLNYLLQHGDMIYLYQMLNNLVDINIGDLFTLSLSTTRGHEFKLYKHHSSYLPQRNFISYHVLNLWNNLPPHIVEIALQTTSRPIWMLTGQIICAFLYSNHELVYRVLPFCQKFF